MIVHLVCVIVGAMLGLGTFAILSANKYSPEPTTDESRLAFLDANNLAVIWRRTGGWAIIKTDTNGKSLVVCAGNRSLCEMVDQAKTILLSTEVSHG